MARNRPEAIAERLVVLSNTLDLKPLDKAALLLARGIVLAVPDPDRLERLEEILRGPADLMHTIDPDEPTVVPQPTARALADILKALVAALEAPAQ